MKKFVLGFASLCTSLAVMALSPYTSGDRLATGDVGTQMTAVTRKLQAEGFTVVGRHTPKGLNRVGTVIVTEPALLQVLGGQGAGGIAGAGIRVGVDADGKVSYMTPEYWYRAYLRGNYASTEPAVKAVTAKLGKALGAGAVFGGDVPAADLANYRYMMGMDRFDSLKSELHIQPNFETAVKTIRDHLEQHVGNTAKVYEIVLNDRKVAVFGVAMNDAERGENWWVSKLGATGPEHVAALPYEIFVVNNKVYGLYARYRIALAWPALSMGDFMNIRYAPDVIWSTLSMVAGGPDPTKANLNSR